MLNKENNINRPQPSHPTPSHAWKAYEGSIFVVWNWNQELFDGSTAIFEKVSRRDSVVIVPIQDNGNIILIKQKQPGREPFISVPGGRIDTNESVLDAAKRELLEETGMKAESLNLWFSVQLCSELDWVCYVFLGKGSKKVADISEDPGESIEGGLIEVSFEDFLKRAIQEDFYDTEIQVEVFRALLDQEKMNKLRTLFDPKTVSELQTISIL